MRVLITDRTGLEWYYLCQGMLGHQLLPREQYCCASGPDQASHHAIFDVSGAMATWISLRHPDWIMAPDPAWIKQKDQNV